VGAILVAGGQGSRLGYDGPKGAFAIGPVSNATLFEIHARKILALERRYGGKVPFYIMTSQANDQATREFFDRHDAFGLSRDRIHFFVQGMWPALWGDGRLIMEATGRLFMSPDGHGGTLSALRDRGMLDDMRRRGLASLFYFQVDNPLVEIADPAFIGAHTDRGAQFSVKVCAKRDPDEGLGVVVRRGGRCAVIEYTELTKEQKNAVLPNGRLKFCYGSVAIHAFALDFLAKEAEMALPLHVAHKKIAFVNEAGQVEKPAAPNGYKFEKFIFDALPDAATALNVEFAREDEFSPVKNAEGADSPATARRDIVRKFARWMEASGVAVPRDASGEPRHAIEIDPCFALDAAELKQRLPRGFALDRDTYLRPTDR
jgi:UDP-N-acetylglucosamine/UDP-N-acetylgalactosamine diphosphorylase